MLNDQIVVDGKIKVDGLTHKYLVSNGFNFVIDPQGNLGLDGKNIPVTDEEISNNIIEFMAKEIKESKPEDIIALSQQMVEMEVTAVSELPQVYQFTLEEPEPAVKLPEAVVEPEPKAEEGFFSSYYNWIFGSKPKEETNPEQSNAPKPQI